MFNYSNCNIWKEMERDAELDSLLMAAQKTVDEKAEKKRKKALLQEKGRIIERNLL